ncbi:MAG: hypothetical protein J4F36_09430 [Nitrosopumilaceae archaeon]|nr:hypothetical protein [Nitrosopumilaceae archaeon]
MEDEWKIKKGQKIRVSTYSSDFEGTVDKYLMFEDYDRNFLGLIDAEEVYDHLYHGSDSYDNGGSAIDYGLAEHRRKVGKLKIPLDKINHYEMLDEDL